MKTKFLALAVGALWLGVGAAAQGAVPDHYKCYKMTETKNKCLGDPTKACSATKTCESQGTTGPCLGFPKGITASLINEWGTELVDVKKPKSICTPVDKAGEGILDPVAHMKRYQILVQKGQPKHVKKSLVMRDQYGDHFFQTIKEDSLLVPTAKSLAAPEPPLLTSDHDHYKCYKIKELKKKCSGDLALGKFPCKVDADCTKEGAPGGFCELGFVAKKANLDDQFEVKEFDVKKPKLICLPTDKNGEGIVNEVSHLVGYQILTPKGGLKHIQKLGVYTNNQYGPEIVSKTVKEEFLFVPALKDPPTVCDCTGATLLGFETGIPVGQPPAGTLSSYYCSNYVDGACADDGDCDFGTCWDPPGICSGKTSLTCSGSSTPCTGTCGEVSSANLPMDLKVGSLYTGGGLNSVPLPLPVPDQGLAITEVTAYDSGTGVLTLAETTPAEVGKYHCTQGRTCQTGGGVCVVDADCTGPNAPPCVDNCIYGPQLPIPNAGTPATSVCVVNAVADDASGTAQCAGGDSDLLVGLRSVIYLNGDLLSSSNEPDVPGVQPCPLCVPICSGGTKDGWPCRPPNPHRSCDAGTRVGKACTSNSDCPNPPNPDATCLPARDELGDCIAGGGTCSEASECLGGKNDGTVCVPETSTPDLLGDAQDSYPTSHTCTLDPLQNITKNIGGLPVDLNMTTGTQEVNAVDRPNGARVFCGFCRDVTGGGSLCFKGSLAGGCPVAIPAADGNAVPCSSDADCVAAGDTYESCVQRNPGGFSVAEATKISVTGNSSGCLGDLNTHPGTLVSIFCVPPTFDATVDAAGDLPGPGAVLLYGEAQLE